MIFDLTIVSGGDSLRGFDFHQIPGEIWGVNWTSMHLYNMGVPISRTLHFDAWQKEYPPIPNDTIQPHFGEWLNRDFVLNRKPMHVGNLNNSTAFAINVAIQRGYKNICVLGADQRGERHWYDSSDFSKKWNFELFDKWFKVIAQGLGIAENVTLVDSACKHLPGISMEQYKQIIGYGENN